MNEVEVLIERISAQNRVSDILVLEAKSGSVIRTTFEDASACAALAMSFVSSAFALADNVHKEVC